MIKSMTGYGTSSYSDKDMEVTVEVKTLNSKFLDLTIRSGRNYSDKEMVIRNLATEKLVRGKVVINIEQVNVGIEEMSVSYNRELFKKYYDELLSMASMVNDNSQDLFRLALQAPDVTISKENESKIDANWQAIQSALKDALDKCDQFRCDEGAALQSKLSDYISSIQKGLDKITEIDPARIKAIRERITNNLEQFIEEEKIDKNRLEQELMFYIEKLDISEEKVRLGKHLNYFEEVLNASESNGKKLGFISQEIGREINTIGSKANNADMQKVVVEMKEELEKIKEQVLNVL